MAVRDTNYIFHGNITQKSEYKNLEPVKVSSTHELFE